jgi:hypothetical protein
MKKYHQPWCELPKDHEHGCQNVTATEYRARIADLEAKLKAAWQSAAEAQRRSDYDHRVLGLLEGDPDSLLPLVPCPAPEEK